MRGRKSGMDEKTLAAHVKHTLEWDYRWFEHQMDIHMCHVIMLFEEKIISLDEAGILLKA